MIKEFVRRSLLMVPPSDRDAVEQAWTHNADANVFDLHSVPYEQKNGIRAQLRDAIPFLCKGASEAFVNVSQAHLHADIEAAVWPGLAGILLSYPESSEDVSKVDQTIGEMELKHGVDVGTIEVVVMIGSMKGVWNIPEICTASPRVTTIGLDDEPILEELGVLPNPDIDPLGHFVRGRMVYEAAGIDETLHGHHGLYRLGIDFPLCSFQRSSASPEEVELAAHDARNSAFNGAICPSPEWVEPCNRGFTPTDAQIEHHHKVQETYAAGVAIGRGAMPFGDGRFVERPYDELAKKVITLREQCEERDAEKKSARS